MPSQANLSALKATLSVQVVQGEQEKGLLPVAQVSVIGVVRKHKNVQGTIITFMETKEVADLLLTEEDVESCAKYFTQLSQDLKSVRAEIIGGQVNDTNTVENPA